METTTKKKTGRVSGTTKGKKSGKVMWIPATLVYIVGFMKRILIGIKGIVKCLRIGVRTVNRKKITHQIKK
jgi:TRAP-type mannitol/chloroaromatic compound transport system permease small subunit